MRRTDPRVSVRTLTENEPGLGRRSVEAVPLCVGQGDARHPRGELAVRAEGEESGYASRSAVSLQWGAASRMSLPNPPSPGPLSPFPKITYLILTVPGDRND